MLEMVARADLPPPPNADGTCSAPDANNPFAEPQFPFGNPPYAARAYSFVSVAQFDALKAAWHFKYLTTARRRRTSTAASARCCRPRAAVLSLRSRGALGRDRRAAQAALSHQRRGDRPEGGRAARGRPALGRATARPRGRPRARQRGGGAVQRPRRHRRHAHRWRLAGLVRGPRRGGDRAARSWRSLESPPRPPMLAAFGGVRPWMMTPADILNERPAPPPSTSSAR